MEIEKSNIKAHVLCFLFKCFAYKKKKNVKTEYQKAISCLPYTLVLEHALKLWHTLI